MWPGPGLAWMWLRTLFAGDALLKISFAHSRRLDDWPRSMACHLRSRTSPGGGSVLPGVSGEPLTLADEAGRVLVSADVKTMLVHFAAFMAHSDSPGIVLIPSSRSDSSIMVEPQKILCCQ